MGMHVQIIMRSYSLDVIMHTDMVYRISEVHVGSVQSLHCYMMMKSVFSLDVFGSFFHLFFLHYFVFYLRVGGNFYILSDLGLDLRALETAKNCQLYKMSMY